MLSGREAELAGRLRDASAQGKTSIVLQLLEEGAPFVVDSVNMPTKAVNNAQNAATQHLKMHFNLFLSAHKSALSLMSVDF